MPAMLMSDDEFNDACDQRELRNNLVCCICERDGLDCEDCYANTEKQKIIVPSCNNVNHSLCIDCLKTIANLILKYNKDFVEEYCNIKSK